MYLHIAKRKKGSYLTICEKYRDKSSKYPKERTVSVIGYAEDYLDKFEDPIAHFRQVAKDMTKESKSSVNSKVQLTIDLDEQLPLDTSSLKNMGYLLLKQVYKELQIDLFWKQIAKQHNFEYDLNRIFQLLVFSRIIAPASKLSTWHNRDLLFEDYSDIDLKDIYRALDIFSKYDWDLQSWIYEHSCIKYKRDLSVTYFDCTNYYWDVSKPDIDELDEEGNPLVLHYRKMGPEKNNRKDPIIELGLLMDQKMIPVAYSLFPGNESEKVHMLPIINKARLRYGFQRTVVVADRGLNTSDNIYYLNGKNDKDHNPRDGYVYGQTVRGADAEFKSWAIDPADYIDTPIMETDENDITFSKGIFRHKSRIYPKKIQVTVDTSKGKKKKVITVDQRQLVYYSAKYAKKQKEARNRSIERAKDLINHPKKYDKVAAKGASGYVVNLRFDKNGEIIDRELLLDEDKIREEEKYDGYYSIVTSELELTDTRIREIYRGLINIENTFKITKSELDTRPIFVRTNEHIEGHFTTCYTALILLRLLEQKIDNKYPTAKIIESIQKYTCAHLDMNHYQFFYYDEILESFSKAFNINLSSKYKTTNEIRRLLKY